ncbi:sulfatase-like hydrolase/transferase [Draconibacterium sediminis]|uniref:N-acetylgalactosamine 6-sulfate sulfatase n=1 Tax=Draconibacterium sediminis TaxID=1544798 RepID=A0A0D8JDR7_9BACT|nr:sulfatase-like hydrolase/transferase [Draconibacterium sediminis]KJF43963.1 N-acetylgalactosamine 6-sulfate sulfatase [Draconibacterium sediminis]
MKTGFLCFLFIAVIFASCTRDEKNSSPNLVLILVDDMGYADVGFNGCTDIPTPNIDKLAEGGVRFTNGYVSYCVCGPSRAGLLTGRYQDRFGFSRNPLFAPNDPGMGLPLTEETLADALKKAGYKSLAIGKWHMGAHESLHPLKRGFDDFYGFLSGGHRYFPEELTLNDPFEATSQYDGYKTRLLRNYERVDETEYLTDALSREAVSYIEINKDNPFFIYLAYNAPHAPLQATEKYLSRFENIDNKKRKTYAAMVSAVDDGVGLILNKLEELNLEENTLVVFLSDNGGPENHNASDNGILRGQKGDLFEGGIRVPFAMKWSGTIPAGEVYENPIISLDIFATIIAQSGKEIPLKNEIDGIDLIPYLKGENNSQPHDQLFWRKFDAQDYAVRQGDDKLLIKADSKNMLFNLTNDISEENNLEEQKPDRILQLTKEFQNWNRNMKDPIFMGLSQDKKYNELHPERFEKLTE